MKKMLFLALAVCLSVFSASSCGGKAGSNKGAADSLTFDSIKVDSTVSLTGDTAGPKCHVSLSVVYAKGKNADYINDSIIRSGILIPDYFSVTAQKITVEQAVDSFMTRYFSSYKRDFGELYKADKAHSASYNCEYLLKTRVESNSAKYLTYVAEIYNYTGGAHGASIVLTKNIDAKTGKIVTLKDIFVPGYEQGLNQQILDGLYKQFEAKDQNGLNEKGVLTGMSIYPSENFIIGDKDITFIYSPDEIACHAAGEIRVKLSLSDLESLLRK